MELEIQYYLIVVGLIKFVIELNILQVKKVVLLIDIINHNFRRIRIDSYNFLPIEKILTLHNVIILIKSVVNNDKNNCCYNIFLGKSSHKDKSNTEYFYMIFFYIIHAIF